MTYFNCGFAFECYVLFYNYDGSDYIITVDLLLVVLFLY